MEEKKRLFVITGTKIRDTGKVSYAFMMKSGAPFTKFASYSSYWGWLQLRKPGENEIFPFEIGKSEEERVDHTKISRWEYFMFKSREGQIATGSVDEMPQKEIEEGLRDLITGMHEGVLLMDRNLFDRFQKACASIPDVELDFHHYEGELLTA